MSKNAVPQIEIEYFSRIDEKSYHQLHDFLKQHGQDLGEDDKDSYFFIFSDKLLKVVDNISKKNAKIALKMSRIGDGSDFEEIEFKIDPQNVDKAVHMFKKLGGYDTFMKAFQKRHNYMYKDVEIAVKYSDNWGYHVEMEIMINNLEEKSKADVHINKIAEELNIKLMTDAELKTFTREVESKVKS
jgi:predicted adenylyl cyclase CyaB